MLRVAAEEVEYRRSGRPVPQGGQHSPVQTAPPVTAGRHRAAGNSGTTGPSGRLRRAMPRLLPTARQPHRHVRLRIKHRRPASAGTSPPRRPIVSEELRFTCGQCPDVIQVPRLYAVRQPLHRHVIPTDHTITEVSTTPIPGPCPGHVSHRRRRQVVRPGRRAEITPIRHVPLERSGTSRQLDSPSPSHRHPSPDGARSARGTHRGVADDDPPSQAISRSTGADQASPAGAYFRSTPGGRGPR
jgi:hypothetical protein